jgi:hypothetical protein
MLPSDDAGYLFGRVIDADANPLGVGGAVLIYVYRPRSRTKKAIPPLTCGDLLVAPMMTNRLPWSKGYFEFLEHRPLGKVDLLARHCFKDSRGWFFDEKGRQLREAIEPVGEWGLHSYRTIDDAISEALGIPLATD